MATKSGLDYNSTFLGISSPNATDFFTKFQSDNTTLYNYLLDNPNATQHALIFISGM